MTKREKAAAFKAVERRATKARVTLHQVFMAAGVSPMTLSRWRRNVGIMKPSTLGKIEAALDRIEAEAAKPCDLCGEKRHAPCDTFGCPMTKDEA